jgi:hypothetical protein
MWKKTHMCNLQISLRHLLPMKNSPMLQKYGFVIALRGYLEFHILNIMQQLAALPKAEEISSTM